MQFPRPSQILSCVVLALTAWGCGGGSGDNTPSTGMTPAPGQMPGGTGGTGGTGAVVPAAGTGGAGMTQMPAAPVLDAPTWHEHIAPLVAQHCAGCHRAGGIAPFSLTTYETAKIMAPGMVAAVKAGRMPPWGAQDTSECKPRHTWKDDLRLSDQKKALLDRWLATGMPAGDAAKAAALPQPPSLDLTGRSARTTMSKPYRISGDKDIFRCFVLPYTFEQAAWITGVQVVPGNPKVVHHVLVWLDVDGKSVTKDPNGDGYACQGHPGVDKSTHIAPWAPGAMPVETPMGVGMPAKKGSKIVVNVHYHPGSGVEMDASSVDIRFTTQKPPFEAMVALIGNFQRQSDGLLPGPNDRMAPEFRIPAGVKDHTEVMKWVAPAALAVPFRLFAVGTHMHYVGRDMKIDIDRSGRAGGAPAGEPASECLVQTPNWDFNWQRGYAVDATLDKMPTILMGDVVTMRCRYDNSMDNQHVRDALAEQGLKEPREVKLGENTLDEMCLGVFGVAYPAQP